MFKYPLNVLILLGIHGDEKLGIFVFVRQLRPGGDFVAARHLRGQQAA